MTVKANELGMALSGKTMNDWRAAHQGLNFVTEQISRKISSNMCLQIKLAEGTFCRDCSQTLFIDTFNARGGCSQNKYFEEVIYATHHPLPPIWEPIANKEPCPTFQ